MYSARADGPGAGDGDLSGRCSSSQSAYISRGASSSALAMIAAGSASWSLMAKSVAKLHGQPADRVQLPVRGRGNRVAEQARRGESRQARGVAQGRGRLQLIALHVQFDQL